MQLVVEIVANDGSSVASEFFNSASASGLGGVTEASLAPAANWLTPALVQHGAANP